ncbi:MAG: DinB family protein [Bacteroidetes bacterium]|nr:DinB family protein [Bacteroidota bacterium]
MQFIKKPPAEEYNAYASKYIDLMPDDGMLLKHLENNFTTVKNFILPLPEEKLLFRYAEKKWTIKEVLVHIIDDERIYAYRAICFARNEKRPLPGFDENDYANYSNANERNLNNIFEEYEAVRKSTIALFNGLSPEVFLKTGIADGRHASVRALAFHIAGHELHHFNIIRERYLGESIAL